MTYTFYVENNTQPTTGLSPTISKWINIETGADFAHGVAISELSEGFYKFEFDWSTADTSIGYLLKIDTTLSDNPGQQHITMRIEPNDYVASIAEEIKTSANSILTSANSIKGYSERLLDIEQGTWAIEGTQLILKSAGYGTVAGTEIARYDLKNELDVPTATNPYKRILVSLAGPSTP